MARIKRTSCKTKIQEAKKSSARHSSKSTSFSASPAEADENQLGMTKIKLYVSKSASSQPEINKNRPFVLKSCLRIRSNSVGEKKARVKKKVTLLIPRQAPNLSKAAKILKTAKHKAMEAKVVKSALKNSCSEILRVSKKTATSLDTFSSELLTALNEIPESAPVANPQPQNPEN